MMKNAFLLLSFFMSFEVLALQSTSSFYVLIQERKISVSSPDKKNLLSSQGLSSANAKTKVSLVFDNKTLDKIYAELKTKSKSIEKFVIKPNQNKTIEVEMDLIGKLSFVPISPPFQAIPLKFSQGTYEIPQTTKEK